jgi:ATP-dependent exoDNAse (exonuclease V) beta subunit
MSAPNFTPRQLDALDISRRHVDACVVAGPGSGKTTVLVEYFKRLVEAGVDPVRILAITFTEKAASQMRRRLADAFRENAELRARLERSWVSTVHGFCFRLLKENAVAAGVDPGFTIAEERDVGRWQQESMAETLESIFADHPAGVRALIRGLSSSKFEDAIVSAYDAMRGAGTDVSHLAGFPAPAGATVADIAGTLRELRRQDIANWSDAQRREFEAALEAIGRIVAAPGPREALEAIEGCDYKLTKFKRGNAAYDLLKNLRDQRLKQLQFTLITELYAAERELLIEVLRRFDRLYRQRKTQAGALDFADLEEFAVKLLETSPETRGRLQSQFEHVLMDELQDTNGQQARLLRLVRPPGRFYAVGDVNQSIFGFRHAEPREFEEFRAAAAQSGGRVVELVENFRSRPEILRAVETVAAGAPGIEDRRLIAGKNFADDHAAGPRVHAIAAPAPHIEARLVARRMLELLDAEPDFAYRDIALLVRNTSVLPEFTAAFDEAGIPYVVNRGKGFYEAREVDDLVQLLRVVSNPLDEISLAAVLRSPLVEVSDDALLRLKLMGGNLAGALMRVRQADDPELDPADLHKLVRFRQRLREWRLRREYVSFDRLLLDAIDECGYGVEAGSRAAANVDKFLAQARAAAPHTSLDGFVEDLEMLRDRNLGERDPAPEDSADAVQVMTVHSAKGLEFPVVFVAAMHKGVESKPPVVAFSPACGLGASWRNPARRQDQDDLFHRAIRDEQKQREEKESNRLLYVAMSRAEHYLALSFSTGGRKPANWAKRVVDGLLLNLDQPGESIHQRVTPEGESWKLRLTVAEEENDESDEQAIRPPAAQGKRIALPTKAPVELLPAPSVAGQYESNVTVTALSRFAKCPRAYYLSHYLGFEGKPRTTPGSGGDDALTASELGTQVHHLLAGMPVDDPDPQAVRLADSFRKSPLGRRVERATHVEREFDFLMAIDDLVVRGQIDLWFEEGGELAIVDYKTDAVQGPEVQQRAREYELQIKLYAMALERMTGRAPDRAFLHFLKPNAVVEVDLTPSLIDSPEQTVRDFMDAQEKLEFPLREGEQCMPCPFYKDLCPAP